MALTGWWRSVRKHVTEMATAACADLLDADHSIAGIAQTADVRFVVGTEEARPARARVKFCIRPKQRQAAEAAGVDAIAVIVEEHATEGGFGAVLEEHTPLIAVETRDDLRALRLARRPQVEFAHHAPRR